MCIDSSVVNVSGWVSHVLAHDTFGCLNAVWPAPSSLNVFDPPVERDKAVVELVVTSCISVGENLHD